VPPHGVGAVLKEDPEGVARMVYGVAKNLEQTERGEPALSQMAITRTVRYVFRCTSTLFSLCSPRRRCG
jgi:hypothetical protein